MWYFAWILGVSTAVMLTVLNAMWFEAQECAEQNKH
jgi:cyd operon protein YbgT